MKWEKFLIEKFSRKKKKIAAETGIELKNDCRSIFRRLIDVNCLTIPLPFITSSDHF